MFFQNKDHDYETLAKLIFCKINKFFLNLYYYCFWLEMSKCNICKSLILSSSDCQMNYNMNDDVMD